MLAVRLLLKIFALSCFVVIILTIYASKDQSLKFQPFAAIAKFRNRNSNFTLFKTEIVKPSSYRKATYNIVSEIIKSESFNVTLKQTGIKEPFHHALGTIINHIVNNDKSNNFLKNHKDEHLMKKNIELKTNENVIITVEERERDKSTVETIHFKDSTKVPKHKPDTGESGKESADESNDESTVYTATASSTLSTINPTIQTEIKYVRSTMADVTTDQHPIISHNTEVTSTEASMPAHQAAENISHLPTPMTAVTYNALLLKTDNDVEKDTVKGDENRKWMLPIHEKDKADLKCSLSHDVDTFHSLLQHWVDLCKKYNISYYLTCGTLLGAYRDGYAIPYDSDIDIIMDSNDIHKLKPLQSKRDFDNDDKNLHLVLQLDFDKPMDERRRFKCNGELTPSYADHCSFQEPLGRLVQNDFHLDLYHYNLINQTIEDPSEGGRIFHDSDIFPTQRCNFMDIEMRCPNKPKTVLSSFYADLEPSKVCIDGEWRSKS